MKTIFDQHVRNELINRINSLDKNCAAEWGKMTVCQMAIHMNIWNEWMLGKNNPNYKQEFIGKILGRMMLRSHTKDDKPMGKGMPAGKGFTVKEKVCDLELQKNTWAELIQEYENYSNPGFVHDFYGKMTKQQIGIFVYKHSDHHLRQFNT